MFIRRTKTASKSSTESCWTHRLVASRRDGDKVGQVTLLNLGAHFPVPKERWKELVARVQALLSGQADLGLEPEPDADFERYAADIARRLLLRSAAEPEAPGPAMPRVTHQVYEDSLDIHDVRKAGVEAAGFWALRELGLDQLLHSLSNQPALANLALASIVMRLSSPGSDRRTHRLMQSSSAAGELLGEDFGKQSLQQLYRSSDLLMDHREAIETHLFHRMMTLFGQEPSVTFYDLTNTYFEGQAKGQAKARHGKSKEKRSDCPLLTLAVVLDGSGAIRRSRVFSGSQSEPKTLAAMLKDLGVSRESLLVMDRGLATEEQLLWLRSQGYRYLAKSRRQRREFDPQRAAAVPNRSPEEQIQVYRSLASDGAEVFLHCRSDARMEKERAIAQRQCARMEAELEKIAKNLAKPRTSKDPERIAKRIGRLESQNPKVSRHYRIDIVKDGDGKASALSWTRKASPNSMLDEPGVYSLRTNVVDQDNDWLWSTYTRLTEIESVFRSLKSELGLRPIFHQKIRRSEGHLFISVIAYQALHLIRTRLKAKGIRHCWDRIRADLDTVIRYTAQFERTDGRWLHIRRSARLTADQQEIFRALGMPGRIGPATRTIVESGGQIRL